MKPPAEARRLRLVGLLALTGLSLCAPGCGEGASPYAQLPGAPPPPEVLGAYRGDGGRLVIRPASDPACEQFLGAAVACYTHDEGLEPPQAAVTDPIDAGPVAKVGDEIVLQVSYSVDPPEQSCMGMRGHHRFVSGPDGRELELLRAFLRDREITGPAEGPCVPPMRWDAAPGAASGTRVPGGPA